MVIELLLSVVVLVTEGDALSLVTIDDDAELPPVMEVTKLLLLVVCVGEKIVLVVVIVMREDVLSVVRIDDDTGLPLPVDVVKPLLLVVGVDEEIVLVVVVDGGLLATVVLLATKVVPDTMYPEASTQLPGAMFALPEVKHAWPTAHDQAWFVPGIKPQQICSTSRQTSPQAR